ncbi:MAG: oxygen-independent coproporphyrinogen III oxidase, partial [Proteobacteria bacterium]|nr:oxygen-independent coproporphyrinogen III oxidase [Pseudomonadota bacterium]
GCFVEIRQRREVANSYVSALISEVELVADKMRSQRTMAQLALGGGTPTFLLPEQMERLFRALDGLFPHEPHADLSIEVDPRTVDLEYLQLLFDLGFRRFSFGVQDFDQEVMALVNRPQPAENTEKAVDFLRGLGNSSINLDLLYGLPLQNCDRFSKTLARVVQMRPSRIALFHYAHVPWMKPAQKLLDRHPRPDSEEKAAMFVLAEEVLGAAGYRRLGLDHFALPHDALLQAADRGELGRNFQGYTTHADLDLIGLGVSAIGSFGGIYAQNTKERVEHAAQVEAGRLPIVRGYRLSHEDKVRRELIMTLMAQFGLRWNERLKREHFAEELRALEPMEADGLVNLSEDGIEITPLGRDFVRNVCAVFDQYFEGDPASRKYSHTA